MATKKKKGKKDNDIIKKLDEALEKLKTANEKSEDVLEKAEEDFENVKEANLKAKKAANSDIESTVKDMDSKTIKFIKDTE